MGRREHEREWRGPQAADRYAPGLTPKPIERGLVAGRPREVMAKVSGSSLGRGKARRVHACYYTREFV